MFSCYSICIFRHVILFIPILARLFRMLLKFSDVTSRKPKSDMEVWLKKKKIQQKKTPCPGILQSYGFLLFWSDSVTFAIIGQRSKDNVKLTKVGFVSALFMITILKISLMLVCYTALRTTHQAFFHLNTREAHMPGLPFLLPSWPAATGRYNSLLSFWELCKHAAACMGVLLLQLLSQILFPPTVTSANG